MASSSSHSRKPNNNKNKSAVSGLETDPQLENTTFVHADPSNFRDVVQKLTGASTDPTVQKLPSTISPHPSNGKHNFVNIGPVRPSFKLQERRQSTRNLQLQLNHYELLHGESGFAPRKRVMNDSPVSTLDTFLAHWSPRTPVSLSPSVQEEIAIVNKGFYLHQSPLAASSRKAELPELLPLFPTSSDS